MAQFPDRLPDDPYPSMPGSDSHRFALDQLLRKHKFTIFSRENNKEPLWEKRGYVLSQSDALDSLDDTEVADAEYQESQYWEDRHET